MRPIFYDTETVGFHGLAVLIQWAEGDGPINLHHVWQRPIQDTLDLIEWMMYHQGGVVGFNLAFDHFHLCKLYTIFSLLDNKKLNPESCVDEIFKKEKLGRSGPCLKPVKACDLMLHARKGKYQSTMDRKDVRIRKVPNALAWKLAEHLEKEIPFKEIYFARRKNKKAPHWQVQERKDKEGTIIDKDFKDVVCKFAPSSALKTLAADALDRKVTKFKEIGIDEHYLPLELGYAPFAQAVIDHPGFKGSKKRGKYCGSWPSVIQEHKLHWTLTKPKEYATDDVIITRDLFYHFGSPALGDDDSELACSVAAVRWKGFAIDISAIEKLREEAHVKLNKKITSPANALRYLFAKMDTIEQAIHNSKGGGTPSNLLDELKEMKQACSHCASEGCKKCLPHPVSFRAKEIIDARGLEKRIQLYDKLILAGRFHASYKVIGTMSSRMSGADGLNATGIDHAKTVRSCFTFADPENVLCGGDFKAFEISIFDACVDDKEIHRLLLEGQKIHAIFGMELYPEMGYEEIVASDGMEEDFYTQSKQGFFAVLYGGEGYTLSTRVKGITEEQGDKAFKSFLRKFTGVLEKRVKLQEKYCPITQPDEKVSRFHWHDPEPYVSSLLGFKRYFDLEFRICKALFDLAESPPREWQKIRIKTQRKDRRQTVSGATRSALYGAAFAIQGAAFRAIINHEIQSTGAEVAKKVQRNLGDIQPIGINKWLVQSANAHDEIIVVAAPEVAERTEIVVQETVKELKSVIPLLAIDWSVGGDNWSEIH